MEVVEAAQLAQTRSAGVAGLIAGALLGRVDRVAAIWPLELAGQRGEAVDVSPAAAEEVVRAAASALRWDDLDPLLSLLDPGADPATLGDRLDHLLACLDAVRRGLMAAVETEEVDARVTAALARQAPTAFARMGRQLAGRAVSLASWPAAPAAAELGGDSLGVTVHELRRPLTILSSYAQLLDAGGLGAIPATAQAAVSSIAQATETMMRLVDGLAAVARLGEAPARPPQPVPIADVVAAAAAEVRPGADLGEVRIGTDVDPAAAVLGDREDLLLALGNLLGNAVKYAPAGTTVEVAARSHAGRVVVSVTDHGPGFPAADAERLFEKYYRVPGEAERGTAGSGLGLFIVRAVAVRHGGTARARLVPGGGAEFELDLPGA